MIEPKEKPEVKSDAKAEPKTEANTDKAPVVEEKKEAKPPVDRRSSLPEFSFKTPEQEKAWLEAFGPGTEQRAMYFRMKNERQQRQVFEKQVQALTQEIAALKENKFSAPPPEVDENGNQIDPDDKPLTVKQWKELQRQEMEERIRQEEEMRKQGGAAAESLSTQEEYAKAIYPDYTDTVKLAIELRNNPELLDTPWKRQQADLLWRRVNEAAAQADKLGIDDLNSAHLAYEMGKLHPNYGKQTNGQRSETHTDGKQDPKNANASVTPEQMKRIEANTPRRVSSASIPGGGGSRTVSVDDVTLQDLNKMTPAQRWTFRSKHPARYEELRRG